MNTLLILLSIFALTLQFHFELQNDNEKCFIDEFFENTVVILHYEILDFDVSQHNGNIPLTQLISY
jgi:hypothetical protein